MSRWARIGAETAGMRGLRFVILLAVLVAMFSSSAFAYLDPGTGSYILQMLLAGILGALFALKVFWKRIVAFVKGLFSKKDGYAGR